MDQITGTSRSDTSFRRQRVRQRSSGRQATSSIETKREPNTFIEIRNEDVAFYLRADECVLAKLDRHRRDAALESEELAMHRAGEVRAIPLQCEVGLTDLTAETAGTEKDVIHPNCAYRGGKLWNLDDNVIEVETCKTGNRVRWQLLRRRRGC